MGNILYKIKDKYGNGKNVFDDSNCYDLWFVFCGGEVRGERWEGIWGIRVLDNGIFFFAIWFDREVVF